MPDLRDQLRTYYEATTEPADLDDLVVEPGTVLVGPFPDASVRRSMGQRDWWRGPVGAVAAVLAVVVVGIVAFLAFRGDAEEAANSTTTSIGAAEGFTAQDAVAVANEYFTAFNRGDVKAVSSLLAPDAVIGFAWGAISVEQFEWFTLWSFASEATGTPVACQSLNATDDLVTVRCEHTRQELVGQLVDGPPVATSWTASIGSEGITLIRELFTEPDYSASNALFHRWIKATHPDDAAVVECCEFESDTQATEYGERHAELAREWAAFLTGNGCVYDEPCTSVADATATAEAFVGALVAGDMDEAEEALDANANVIGGFDALERTALWNVAQQTTTSPISCAPIAEPITQPVELTCAHTERQLVSELVDGPSADITFEIHVGAAGITHVDDTTVDDAFAIINTPFHRWVAAEFPGDERIIDCCGWTSAEAAIAAGELRARYAQLYAAYLEDNGCTFDQPCEP